MISLIFAFLLSLSAQAAPMNVGSSLTDLVMANPNVVRGTVVKSSSWSDGEDYQTKYTIAIFHQIRGQGPEMLTTTLPGGTVRERTQRIKGYPVWNEGDIVVLFLDSDLNLAIQGMFTVEGNVLIDPFKKRAGNFPSLYTELTHDLRRVTHFSPLPRGRALRGPKAPTMVP
jgi:hypothetical protein